MLKNRSEEDHRKRPGATRIRSLPLYVSSKDNPEEMEEFSLGLNVGLNHSLSSLTSQISKAINIDPIPKFRIQVSLALLVH